MPMPRYRIVSYEYLFGDDNDTTVDMRLEATAYTLKWAWRCAANVQSRLNEEGLYRHVLVEDTQSRYWRERIHVSMRWARRLAPRSKWFRSYPDFSPDELPF